MKYASMLFVMAFLCACTNNKKVIGNKNTEGWMSLFNGTTTDGWHSYGKPKAGKAWKAENGILHLDATEKESWQTKNGGDLVSDGEYENFDLQLEWKISRAGNSGVMFFVKEDPVKYEYSWQTGPEMQIADNEENEDGKIDKHRAGEIYELYSASKEVIKKAGEWNKFEIVSKNGKLDLYVNEVHTIAANLLDSSWSNRVRNSKFNSMPDFAKFKKGHFALQDHGADVWFRNIKIKML